MPRILNGHEEFRGKIHARAFGGRKPGQGQAERKRCNDKNPFHDILLAVSLFSGKRNVGQFLEIVNKVSQRTGPIGRDALPNL